TFPDRGGASTCARVPGRVLFIGRSSRRPPFRHQHNLSCLRNDGRHTMALPFFLAGILGKAAAGALPKGLAARVWAAGAKPLVGSQGHRGLAQGVAGAAAEKLTDSAVDAVFAKMERKDKGNAA